MQMRRALWQDYSESEMRADMKKWLATPTNATFVLLDAEKQLCGFIEVGSRNYAEGCETSPIGYIEGWYVDDPMRGQGGGKMLTTIAEDWVRTQGWVEIASDTWLGNETSIQAHLALGYEETERLVHFSKKIA